MFGRRKASDAPPLEAAAQPPERAKGKNRPTPTRREAQAARRQPLVPADRKAAQHASRVKERESRARQRAAMLAGEPWALAPRDRTPQRAYIRDYVDARWTVGEFIMPIVLVGFALSILPSRGTATTGFLLVYGGFLLAMLDLVVLWQVLKRRIRAKFGAKPARGDLWYTIMRVLQIRVGRIPRPRVRRRQYPV